MTRPPSQMECLPELLADLKRLHPDVIYEVQPRHEHLQRKHRLGPVSAVTLRHAEYHFARCRVVGDMEDRAVFPLEFLGWLVRRLGESHGVNRVNGLGFEQLELYLSLALPGLEEVAGG